MVYNFASENNNFEVAELLDAEAVRKDIRVCKWLGQDCKDDCDCCNSIQYCNCPLYWLVGKKYCSCIHGDNGKCHKKQRECKVNRPYTCPQSSRGK